MNRETESQAVHHRQGMERYYAKHGGGGFWHEKYPAHWSLIAERRIRRDRVIAASLPPGAACVLDVGCGLGDVLLQLDGRCRLGVGVDPVFVHAAGARDNLRHCANFHFAQSLGERLPAAGDTFDAVILADVIEHVYDPPASLAECRRVLRPGGRLIVVTPNRPVERFWAAVDEGGLNALRALLGRTAMAENSKEAFRDEHFSMVELRAVVETAGFTVEQHERFDFYPGAEGNGTLKAILARLPVSARERVVEPAVRRISALVERLDVFNNRQLMVARR